MQPASAAAGAAGTSFLRELAAGTAGLKRMWVHPEGRGMGVALLLEHLEATAVQHGRPVVRYNDNPHTRQWFEKRLSPAPSVWD